MAPRFETLALAAAATASSGTKLERLIAEATKGMPTTNMALPAPAPEPAPLPEPEPPPRAETAQRAEMRRCAELLVEIGTEEQKAGARAILSKLDTLA